MKDHIIDLRTSYLDVSNVINEPVRITVCNRKLRLTQVNYVFANAKSKYFSSNVCKTCLMIFQKSQLTW